MEKTEEYYREMIQGTVIRKEKSFCLVFKKTEMQSYENLLGAMIKEKHFISNYSVKSNALTAEVLVGLSDLKALVESREYILFVPDNEINRSIALSLGWKNHGKLLKFAPEGKYLFLHKQGLMYVDDDGETALDHIHLTNEMFKSIAPKINYEALIIEALKKGEKSIKITAPDDDSREDIAEAICELNAYVPGDTGYNKDGEITINLVLLHELKEIYVVNSKENQEKAFYLGWHWSGGNYKVSNLQEKYLVLRRDPRRMNAAQSAVCFPGHPTFLTNELFQSLNAKYFTEKTTDYSAQIRKAFSEGLESIEFKYSNIAIKNEIIKCACKDELCVESVNSSDTKFFIKLKSLKDVIRDRIVYVNNSEENQKRAFSLGWSWAGGDTSTKYLKTKLLILKKCNSLFTVSKIENYQESENSLFLPDDIFLSEGFEKMIKENCVKIDYSAEIKKAFADGCMIISFPMESKIDKEEVSNAIKKESKLIGHWDMDSTCVIFFKKSIETALYEPTGYKMANTAEAREHAFKLGYKWTKTEKNGTNPFLFLANNKIMSSLNSPSIYEGSAFKYISLADFLKIQPPVDMRDLFTDIHKTAVENGHYEGMHPSDYSDKLYEKVCEEVNEMFAASGYYPKGEGSFEATIKNTLPDEMADIIMTIVSFSKQMGIDIIKHIQLKNEYNKTREYGND